MDDEMIIVADAALNQRQAEMFQQWRATGDPQLEEDLLKSFEPLIVNYIGRYSSNPIQFNDLKARAFIQVRNALPKYDPSRAQMSTFVVNNLAPLNRYVHSYQNPTYISEELSSQFGRVDAARRELENEMGRSVTDQEIATRLSLPTKAVERISMAMNTPTLISSLADEAETEGIVNSTIRRQHADAMAYLRAELEGKERKAYDLIIKQMAQGGRVSMKDIAGKVGVEVDELYAWRKEWNRRLRDAQSWS